MGRPANLVGKVYGKLRVKSLEGSGPRGRRWLCVCECGGRTIVTSASLNSGNSQSCGCVRGMKHGLKSHPLYGTWKMMKHRCYNPRSRSYERYGGRGIRVCKRWLYSPKNFIEDMGERPEGMTLDRKIRMVPTINLTVGGQRQHNKLRIGESHGNNNRRDR